MKTVLSGQRSAVSSDLRALAPLRENSLPVRVDGRPRTRFGFTPLEWQFLGAVLAAEFFLLSLAACVWLCLAM